MKIFGNKGPLSSLALKQGILNQAELESYLRTLPYGRTKQRDDFSLVLSEGKGTCSTKHALYKSLSLEQGWTEVALFLVMYKMNKDNTPLIGNVLDGTGLSYLPEAHCILRIGDKALDLTTQSSDFEALKGSILIELEIVPRQVGNWKVEFHQEYLKKWMQEEASDREFKEIWALREDCIQRITENGG